ncbi:MAG: hypothetical protein RMJ98_03960 [Myxococcales bacterium]|nr:hypothetical protein [Polyangiaceae bacterium]MDW8248444.1 hypothetical protein [Myxococcales bacterium]
MRVYRIIYTDIHQFVAHRTQTALDERFSYVEGQVIPDGQGGWLYLFEAATYYNPSSPPNDEVLLAGLPPGAEIEETSYTGWITRLDPTVNFLKTVGAWTIYHPWLDVFLPRFQSTS